MFKIHRNLTGHEAQDLHTATAALVFKVPYEAVTSQQRVFAKRVNFGLNYGQGVRGLAEVTGLTMDEAATLINDYMLAYPGIRIYQARKKTAVFKGNRIPNAYGRWRHNYGVKEMRQFLPQYEYEKQLAGLWRQCVNYPVQSSPADIMANVTIALADVWGVEREDWEAVEALVYAKEIIGGHPATMLRDMGCKMVNLVHDSTQWEIPEKHFDEAASIIETVMVELPFQQLNWYLPVDLKSGPYWGYHEEAA
jgi:DNA polymerase I-like protein with 3'-5' exonuclease and polymerase domains